MDEFQDQARSCLLRLWGPAASRRFVGTPRIPVPLPVSLDRDSLSKITPSQRRTAWVSRKADGERCFLMFGCMTDAKTKSQVRVDEDGSPVVFAAETGRKGFSVDVTRILKRQVPRDLFAGTLLDCEKMPDGTYLVFDGVAIRGRSCIDKPYSEVRSRLAAICAGPDCLTLKPAVQVRAGPRARDILQNCVGAGSDGAILTLEDRRLRPGPCWDTLKFKEDHTVDLGVGPGLSLFVGDRGSEEEGLPKWWKQISSDVFEVSQMPVGPVTGFQVYEFKLGNLLPSGKRRLTFVKERADKSLPNTMQVFRSSVMATEDRLTGKDVADLLGCK